MSRSVSVSVVAQDVIAFFAKNGSNSSCQSQRQLGIPWNTNRNSPMNWGTPYLRTSVHFSFDAGSFHLLLELKMLGQFWLDEQFLVVDSLLGSWEEVWPMQISTPLSTDPCGSELFLPRIRVD